MPEPRGSRPGGLPLWRSKQSLGEESSHPQNAGRSRAEQEADVKKYTQR